MLMTENDHTFIVSESPDEPMAVIQRLRPNGILRCHTGLLLISLAALNDVENWATRHGLDTIDYTIRALTEIPADSRFVPMTPDSEAARLRRIADADAGSPVLLITQFDLAVARLSAEERPSIWRAVFTELTQTRHGLLIAMPKTARRLLPEEMLLASLRSAGRMIEPIEREII